MSTIAVDNIQPSAGGTSFSTDGVGKSRAIYAQQTPAILESENFSSITDNATGSFDINLTNAMATDTFGTYSTYGTTTASISNDRNIFEYNVGLRTTSLARFGTTGNTTEVDVEHSTVGTMGDLA